MSNRSLLELNHDYEWKQEDLDRFRASGDPERSLPAYATFYGMRHHTGINVIDRLRAENEALRSIILWALGENGDFPDRPERVEGKPHPLYWWRTEMRKRLNAAMREPKK